MVCSISTKIVSSMKSFLKKIVPGFILNWYYAAWPFLGALRYRFPSSKLVIIGITGTNGKTTVTHLVTHILEQAGHQVASISSLRFKIAENEWKNKLKMTMPGRMKIQKFMRDAVRAGCTHFVFEVTSEGIKQQRHRCIHFDTAVFTNLTPEHIESHGSFEQYRAAKEKLFALPHRVSVVNLDDDHAGYFLQFPAQFKVGYYYSREAIENIKCQLPDVKCVTAKEARVDSTGIAFTIRDTHFTASLLGQFNLYNSLAALSVGLVYGVNLKMLQKGLKTFIGMPGRMEIVIHKPFTVVVDYAHTPDSLFKVYETLKTNEANETKKLICVFGSTGGGRDKWKRPEMGKIAAQYCDQIILTNEDPYDENPQTILDEIASGFSNDQVSVIKLLDRREAILRALELANEGDIVVITGKGAEPILMTNDGPMEWDDREVVREEFEKIF